MAKCVTIGKAYSARSPDPQQLRLSVPNRIPIAAACSCGPVDHSRAEPGPEPEARPGRARRRSTAPRTAARSRSRTREPASSAASRSPQQSTATGSPENFVSPVGEHRTIRQRRSVSRHGLRKIGRGKDARVRLACAWRLPYGLRRSARARTTSDTSLTCRAPSTRMSAVYCCAPVTRSIAPTAGVKIQ